MTLEELKEAVNDFFGDTSRTQEETADGLREVAAIANELADVLAD